MTESWNYLEDGIMPQIGETVLVWDTNGAPHLCTAIYRSGDFYMRTGGHLENVIAWQHEPKEPKRFTRRKVLGDDYGTKCKP